MKQGFELYYTEVMSGMQTQTFHPAWLVDISTTEARKRAACYTHASQNADDFYSVHALMDRFRGSELGVKYAEPNLCHTQDGRERLTMVS